MPLTKGFKICLSNTYTNNLMTSFINHGLPKIYPKQLLECVEMPDYVFLSLN